MTDLATVPSRAGAAAPRAGTADRSPLRIDPSAVFHVLLNGGSGRKDLTATRAALAETFGAAGRRFELHLIEDASALDAVARRTVAHARGTGGVVVAAGGDGTVNAVVHAVVDSGAGPGCPFGVVPQGTFNYFGRTHGISQETAEAAALLTTADAHPVQVGRLNDRVFLVNASIGLYPTLLEERETYKRQFGRSRIVAFGAGLASLLRGHRGLRLQIATSAATAGPGPAVPDSLRTPTLFVANNRLQLEQIGIAEAPVVEQGLLVAVASQPVSRAGMLWLLLRGAAGRLGDADKVQRFVFEQIEVLPARSRLRHRPVKVATDGEIAWLDWPLRFGVVAEPLYLLKPAAAPEQP